MILAVDVNYRVNHAITAGVVFERWADAGFRSSHVSVTKPVNDYIPGQFYKRELPCILQLLSENELSVDYILVDAYVYLDGHSRPGLGRHLFDALKHKVKVIGVAKNPFSGIADAFAVYRGDSKKPLYVTAAGESPAVAGRLVQSMHGQGRLPALLKQVDRLSRTYPYQ